MSFVTELEADPMDKMDKKRNRMNMKAHPSPDKRRHGVSPTLPFEQELRVVVLQKRSD